MKAFTARATVKVLSKGDGIGEVETEQQFRGEGQSEQEAQTSLLANMQLLGATAKDIIGEVEYQPKSLDNIRSREEADAYVNRVHHV